MSDYGVTIVVTRTVKPGMDAACEEWVHGVSEIATRFPGHLGITIFRPALGSRDYTCVFRFASEEQLGAWEKSPEREEWVRRADTFTERAQVVRHTGLETWFAAPGAPLAMPARWKMVVVTWCVAFPLIQVFSNTVGELPIHPLVRGGVVGLAMVLTMTYVAMPNVTRLLRRWLYAH
jgi:uncharacterized protein